MFIGYEFLGQERLGDNNPLARAADIRPAMIGRSKQGDDRSSYRRSQVHKTRVIRNHQARDAGNSCGKVQVYVKCSGNRVGFQKTLLVW